MKKRIWGIYYVVVLLAVGISAVVFRDRLVIGWASFLPVLCAIGMVCTKFFDRHGHLYPKYRRKITPVYRDGVKRWIYCGREDDGTRDETTENIDHFLNRMLLLFLPLYLPFVFFFPTPVKLTSLLLIVAPYVITVCYALPQLRAAAQKASEARTKELEEQRKREEMGKWKS